ncbi:MAG TPA: DUF1073 domain-containing protein [Leptospiraceae bacterium]|nr:DUF1073 domain-containing protein [Leptospiraceae bacterium]
MSTRKKRGIARRYDAFIDQNTGRGTERDKLSGISGTDESISPKDARRLYRSNGFIQTVADSPAEDATKEWIEIETNREDIQASRLIMNRLEDLKIRQKILKLIRYSRMYCEGAVLYYCIKTDIPETDLSKPIENILSLEAVNVVGADRFSVQFQNYDPLHPDYSKPSIVISGKELHPQRYSWLVNQLIDEDQKGISVVQTVYDAVKAQDTALWSVNSIIYELAVTVFKSPRIAGMDPEEIFDFIAKFKAVYSTQSAVAAAPDEDIDKKTIAMQGAKELFDYIFENMSGLSRIPKSRLMGQAQGVIKSGEYDMLSYYDTVARLQENELRPILEKIITFIVHEQNGELRKKLGLNAAGLDWKLKFRSLWKMDEAEEADIELKHAQADQIYVQTTVAAPAEIRKRRFEHLEEYTFEEAPIDFNGETAQPVQNPQNGEMPKNA